MDKSGPLADIGGHLQTGFYCKFNDPRDRMQENPPRIALDWKIYCHNYGHRNFSHRIYYTQFIDLKTS